MEIFYLYSSRNRIRDYKINVFDGGKINYDYDWIEDILEKEFIFTKKIFSENQRVFIFSNNIFSGERNNLFIELNKKYPQKEFEKEFILYIKNFFRDNNLDNNEELLKNCYYNLQYIIIYLMVYKKMLIMIVLKQL